MRKEMIWAYLIHLGYNMWSDGPNQRQDTPFYEKLYADDDIWKKVVDFLPSQGINMLLIDVGEGLQYESHPEISIEGAWSKDKLKAELDRIRSLGITPIPKLNFSKGHDAWLGEYHYMVSIPKYYQVCEDLIKEVAEVFDYPEYFHLGLDEENIENQWHQKIAIVRHRELWWHDVNFYFQVCDKVGARPWVWADPCWDNPEEYLRKMSKSVLQSNWYYGRFCPILENSVKKVETYELLEKSGFDQIPTCSSYVYRFNHVECVDYIKKVISEERLKGMMTAPWFATCKECYYDLLSDASHLGDAKRKYYAEP